ncbi:hypothetical protein D3OALGA1CA_1908 [Olavius algarvensis associated proteobacterium Delta 3]|nr:hypothetical protein D3OALGA1CA_1908 [Olavius algarvensis associated proteobacterium Delta 3]
MMVLARVERESGDIESGRGFFCCIGKDIEILISLEMVRPR